MPNILSRVRVVALILLFISWCSDNAALSDIDRFIFWILYRKSYFIFYRFSSPEVFTPLQFAGWHIQSSARNIIHLNSYFFFLNNRYLFLTLDQYRSFFIFSTLNFL